MWIQGLTREEQQYDTDRKILIEQYHQNPKQTCTTVSHLQKKYTSKIWNHGLEHVFVES